MSKYPVICGTAAAAEAAGVTPQTIRAWVRVGKLPERWINSDDPADRTWRGSFYYFGEEIKALVNKRRPDASKLPDVADIFSLRQVAAEYGLHKHIIYSAYYAGHLRGINLGRHLLFVRQDLDHWSSNRRKPGVQPKVKPEDRYIEEKGGKWAIVGTDFAYANKQHSRWRARKVYADELARV